jgi:hypothetical protein
LDTDSDKSEDDGNETADREEDYDFYGPYHSLL